MRGFEQDALVAAHDGRPSKQWMCRLVHARRAYSRPHATCSFCAARGVTRTKFAKTDGRPGPIGAPRNGACLVYSMSDDCATAARVKFAVDGIEHETEAGRSLLPVLLELGLEVPHLCHDSRLAPAGVCRLCAVEVDGKSEPVMACTSTITDGMIVRTRTRSLERHRRMVLQMLATRFPADTTGSDPLHEYFARHGIAPSGVRNVEPDDAHPYIHVDMARCIDCYRCVRICRDLQGQDVWSARGRGEALRMVPDGPTLRDSSCVSCGACVDTCPSGALTDRSMSESDLPDHWTRSTCPYCGTGCEINIGTRAGRITTIRPVLDCAVSRGHLCVKGRYAYEFVHAPDRVTRPMVRRNGAWESVSWTEATHFVAERLAHILKEHGPDSIGVLGSARATNEDNYIAQKFARVVLRTNNVDCCARVCHGPSAAALGRMFGTGAATNSFADIEHSACFLLCGCNATENHPIVGARIRQAVRRGARLIVIDPRRIELAAEADIHLQVRPGRNVPLLNALAHVLFEENLFDAEFLRDRVDGVDQLRERVARYSPERIASDCGVTATDIRAAARLYATSKPAMAFHGLGVTEHIQGTDGVSCLANLALLTGNIGKRGAGVNPLRGQNNVQGAAHMGCEPSHLTGYRTIDDGRELFSQVWGVPPPSTPGLNLLQMMDAAHEGALRALWAIGYDILLTNANAHYTDRALRRVDFVIAQDMFMNETAREYAHVFLPVTCSFEKDGTFMNSERRIQRVRPAIAAPAEARDDFRIVCDVARAMGHAAEFSFESAEAIWNEIRKVWPAGAGTSYGRLEHGGLQWPCPTEAHPGTEILHIRRFSTGERAHLALVEFTPSPESPSAEYPFVLVTGRTLHQFNAGTMTMRTDNVDLRPTDTLDISPKDAERIQVQTGSIVTVRSRYGTATMPVRVTGAVREGEVFATFHTTTAFMNRVTGPHRDSVTSTPEYKVTAVTIQKSC